MAFPLLQQTEEDILKIVDNQTVLVTIDKNTDFSQNIFFYVP